MFKDAHLDNKAVEKKEVIIIKIIIVVIFRGRGIYVLICKSLHTDCSGDGYGCNPWLR